MKRLSTLLILLFSAVAHAEVVYDGTQGASGSVDLDVNNTYLVDASDGNTFAAPNVFFSFSNMNVEAGNTLLFTNSSGARYDNLIARVTGGSPSLIDGSIASEVQGANLWIVNPYGMVFGNGSSVNVMGSFHVSTADYIEFEGGIRYAATNTGSDFLVDGNPTKLGFLDKVPQQNGEITLSNTKITVGEGESISLIGGDINISLSGLDANNGNIQVVSITGSGEVVYSDNTLTAINAQQLGKISLKAASLRTGEGDTGSIRINAEQIENTNFQHIAVSKEEKALPQFAKLHEESPTKCVSTSVSDIDFIVKEEGGEARYFLTQSEPKSADASKAEGGCKE